MPTPIEIFFSYAHEDKRLMDDVRRQLILYDRKGIIIKRHDRQIPPGSDWRKQIDGRLLRSHIILLFISPYFFESDYCYEIEMPEALSRHEKNLATVIPIILSPVLWEDAPFGALKALPTDGKPITEWSNRGKACKNVAEGIMKVVSDIAANAKV